MTLHLLTFSEVTTAVCLPLYLFLYIYIQIYVQILIYKIFLSLNENLHYISFCKLLYPSNNMSWWLFHINISFMFLLTWLLLLGDYSWCSSRICPQFLCVLHWTHSLAEKTRWDANAAFWDCMPNGHKCLKLHAQFHKIPNSSLTFLRTHTQFLQMIRGVKDEFHNIHLEVIIQCSMASLELSLWRNEDRINLIQSSSWQL